MIKKNPYEPIISSMLEPYQNKPEDGKYRDLTFNGSLFNDLFVEEFNGCVFTKIQFTGDLKKIKCIDCIFDHCDFSNCDLSACLIQRCRFVNCKGTGSIFRKSVLKYTGFDQCIFPLTDFSECLFDSVNLKECNFSECAFQAIKQKNFVTHTVDFTQTDFTETSLDSMDLSTCKLEGVRLSPHRLKGVMVNSYQAIGLAVLLGVKVKD